MLVSLYEFYICYKLKVIITTDKKRNIEERNQEENEQEITQKRRVDETLSLGGCLRQKRTIIGCT